MKELKDYVKESILDDIDDQIDDFSIVDKLEITKWLKANVKSIQENKLKFDFNTASITVNYDGDIQFKDNITSLTDGSFQWGEVGGYFDCSYCSSLKSLDDAPKNIGSNFYCRYCASLTTLEGSPMEVGGYFSCSDCKSLKSLKGAPKKVGKNFYCKYCDSLESLKGAPENVEGEFNCANCKSLKSLKGAPKKVGRDFYCCYCKTTFTEDDVKKVSDVKGKIYC